MLRFRLNSTLRSKVFSKLILLVWLCVVFTMLHWVVSDHSTTPSEVPGSESSKLNKQLNSTTDVQVDLLKDEPEPLVDNSAANKTAEQLILEESPAIRNLPVPPSYILGKDKNGPNGENKSCAGFPTLYHIQFHNFYWQTLRTSEGTIQFLGAYYDNRSESRVGPSLRFTAMLNWNNRTNLTVTTTTFCQLWFDNEKKPQFSKVLEYKLIWDKHFGVSAKIEWYPYLITCQIPSSHKSKVPKSVSVVESRCDTATNNLRVHFDKPREKKDFAVCVKGLDYPHVDLSVRLIEWIELLGILGADKIFFYEFALHPNTSKVLKYYKDMGLVDVSPLSVPGGQPNRPFIRHFFLKSRIQEKRLNEVIPYNDCLYRNIYSYKYITLLDIDEVIVPKKVDTWKELVDLVDRNLTSKNPKRKKTGYAFQNVFFQEDMKDGQGWFPGIPKYLHMLQHVYRAQNYSKQGHRIKCFHNPEKIYALHNHYPFEILDRSSLFYPIVDTEIAHLQHYRQGCTLGSTNCDKMFLNKSSVIDTTLWKYRDPLTKRSNTVLQTLGFIPPMH